MATRQTKDDTFLPSAVVTSLADARVSRKVDADHRRSWSPEIFGAL